MSDGHDVQADVRKFLIVFVVLLILTGVTVAVSYLHVETHEAVAIALFVATIKASLVAGFFMHLISEKRLIKILLGFVAFFFIGMIGLIVQQYYDTPENTSQFSIYTHKDAIVEEAHHGTEAHAEEGHH